MNDKIEEIVNKYTNSPVAFDDKVERVIYQDRYFPISDLVNELTTLIETSKREVAEKLFKTLLCIEGINSDDFAEEMDCKAVSKKKFTQKEAKEFQTKMVATYYLSHNIVASCCRNRHDGLLEKTYKSLVDSHFFSADTLKESLDLFLSQKLSNHNNGGERSKE